jgi:hypothetical protein
MQEVAKRLKRSDARLASVDNLSEVISSMMTLDQYERHRDCMSRIKAVVKYYAALGEYMPTHIEDELVKGLVEIVAEINEEPIEVAKLKADSIVTYFREQARN